jgi:hypothetical protein
MPNVNACVPPIASTDAQRYLKVPKRSLFGTMPAN